MGKPKKPGEVRNADYFEKLNLQAEAKRKAKVERTEDQLKEEKELVFLAREQLQDMGYTSINQSMISAFIEDPSAFEDKNEPEEKEPDEDTGSEES